jgi:uncharacterized protein YbbK (DUF523 family)/ribosomal protein S18 acetylase RimI-like enzyme
MLEFREVLEKTHIEDARILFREYAEFLGVDLCFQGFAEELASLPGKYTRPKGLLLLAYEDETPAGCVGVRELDDGVCEMKRLYVRPQFRRRGIGTTLAERTIDFARENGYTNMKLDTLRSLKEALTLYKGLGFYEIEPYYHNPIEGAVYLELKIQSLILVSACLVGECCRYDGASCRDERFVGLLAEGRVVPVCPEVLGGLEIPRERCEITGDRRRVISASGVDRTEFYLRGALETLRIARRRNIDVAVLKSRSPSCGYGKIHDGSFSGRLIDGNGVAAEKLANEGLIIYTELTVPEGLLERARKSPERQARNR